METEGYTQVIINKSKNLKYIELGILRLSKENSFTNKEESKETALIILSGRCTIKCGKYEWKSLGERNSVFDGKACAVYIPIGYKYEVIGEDDMEIVVCKAPSDLKSEPVLITPNDVKCRIVGKSNWERKVCDIISLGVNAKRLIVGETFNSPGNWSSYPPHKHDEDNLPYEVKMEEIYFFKINPQQGFGIQRIYTKNKGIDEVYVVENNDVIVIPKGYHPVVAAPGYSLYYLWVLAGENRILKSNDDPEHAWIKIKK
jgi:5-deoxy-glucuronate isomerase